VVYVDLKSAYDKIWHAGLLHKLKRCGIKGKLLNWLAAYLTDRKFQVRVEGSESSSFCATSGVPQGGVLSPLLFNVMLADIPTQDGIQQYIYADDITFSCCGQDPVTVKTTMETYLLSFEKWCLSWGVVINPSKTRAQHFTRKRIPCPEVQLGGTTITYSKTQRLLGLLLDSPLLTWANHLQYLKVECIKRLNVMKALSSTNWGADAAVQNIFYISFVRAKLDYGSMIYGSALESHLRKLDVVQNTCMRLILGARRSTPILSLQAETHLPPLTLRRKYLSAKMFIKLLHRPTRDATVATLKITRYSDQLPQSAPICSFMNRTLFFMLELSIGNLPRQPSENISTVPPWDSAGKFISLGEGEADSGCNALFQDYVSCNYSSYSQIFCDGSQLQKPQSTASGMYIPETKLATCWRLNPQHSVTASELFAIWKSLKYVELHRPQDYIIFSDSRTALQLLQAPSTSYITIVDKIVKLLLELNCTQTVVVHWVRAHVGITGNEVADKTAKLGHSASVSALYRLSREEYLIHLRALFRSYWDDHWKSTVLCSQKGRFLHSIRTTVHQVLPVPTTKRREAIVLYRLRMGHVGLMQYLHRFNMKDSDLCETCALPETVEHYLLYCTAYDVHRQELYDGLNTLDIVLPTLQVLLGGGNYCTARNRKILRLTLTYIRSTGRLEEL
jgi:ribonuclease HI